MGEGIQGQITVSRGRELKKVLLAFFILSVVTGCFFKRPVVQERRCYLVGEIGALLSPLFGDPEALKGFFSFRWEKDDAVALLRGEFLYRRGRGVWAEIKDPWGRGILEVWLKGEDYSVFYPKGGLLFVGKIKEEACFSVNKPPFIKFPRQLKGNLGRFGWELTLKEISEDVPLEFPSLDLSTVKGVFQIEDLEELLERYL